MRIKYEKNQKVDFWRENSSFSNMNYMENLNLIFVHEIFFFQNEKCGKNNFQSPLAVILGN